MLKPKTIERIFLNWLIPFIQARRSGVNCLILPVDNKKDFEELPTYITEGLEVHFAETYEDVYKIAFSDAETTNNDVVEQEPLQKISTAAAAKSATWP